jgi:hypothetical protein
MLTPEQRDIMEHATAWRTANPLHRNHYVLCAGAAEWREVRALCASGLMRQGEVSASGAIFHVTPDGLRALQGLSSADDRPYLVGESNPYGADPSFALYPSPHGCAGWRLAHIILGMTDAQYLASFNRRNLLTRGRWSVPRAREAAQVLAAEARDAGAPLILLGANVADAFGCARSPGMAMGRVQDASGQVRVLIPHPSGRCRVWSYPGAIAQARSLVLALIEARRAGKGATLSPLDLPVDKAESGAITQR